MTCRAAVTAEQAGHPAPGHELHRPPAAHPGGAGGGGHHGVEGTRGRPQAGAQKGACRYNQLCSYVDFVLAEVLALQPPGGPKPGGPQGGGGPLAREAGGGRL